MRILMVCLGNICRSPLADGILRSKVTEKKLPWIVDSAGTAAYHIGNPPDHRMIQTAKSNGIDISELKTLQLKLDDTQHQNELILKSSQIGIVIIENDWSVTFWNPQAEKIFGWKSDEVIGNNLSLIIFPKIEKVNYDIRDYYKKNKEQSENKKNFEFTAITKEKKERERLKKEIENAKRADEEARKQVEIIDAKVLSNRKPPYSLAGGLYDAMQDAGGDVLARPPLLLYFVLTIFAFFVA